MLGKRCRTLQRTASISQNMGPHCLHHHNYHNYHDLSANSAKANAENILSCPSQSTNPHVPTIIPQIIGFNPIVKQDQSPQSKVSHAPDHPSAQNTSARRPLPHDMYDDDPACANTHNLQHKLAGGSTTAVPSKQSQITPRSALQTLLAAARQITCTDQPPTLSKIEGNKSPLIKASAASPSCATNISAKQGFWQGFTASESKSKEISTNQSLIKTAVITTETKATPESYNMNMSEAEGHDHNIFYVEGTSNLLLDRQMSLEFEQNRHALYLATSPLAADFTPNLAASMSFMESCSLCKRQLGQGRDIFMYRGESAFCSMECRDKQMRMEEKKEKLIRCMEFKMNNNMQKQEFYNHTNIVSSNGAPHRQHNKPHHHPHEYSSQAYNNKQNQTSLLMPAA